MKFIDEKEALFIHSVVIDETGGSHGIRDMGLLKSALARPQQAFGGHDLYPTIQDKAAALVTSLVKNHPFVDGNKRSASVCLGVFLESNSCVLTCSSESLVKFICDVAVDNLNQAEIVKWIASNVTKLRKND